MHKVLDILCFLRLHMKNTEHSWEILFVIKDAQFQNPGPGVSDVECKVLKLMHLEHTIHGCKVK